jgi:DNA-binding NarL/FixJ family response regulator
MVDRLSMNEGDLVGVPIVHQGITHGVVQFTTETPRDWNAHDFSVLTAISSALGLWATHPHTPVAPLYRSAGIEPMLMFTQRQQDIVELVNRGVGNHQIATELHVSVSTVKQELQRIMRSTSTSDRLTAAQRAVEMGLLAAAEN